MAVKPGDLLRERYRIDALIGRGGMGQVFAATALQTQARVAIKVVSRLLVDDVLMVRLHREAEAAQRIRSDYVPHVYEVSDTEEGETFLVMERLVGEPLSQRIRDNGALPWSEVRRIGEDVLHGLVDAHAAGVVHRDLKPSNVFLALKKEDVRSMVLDFGVCKMAGVDAERLTGTGESIGTVAYMAPEQIRGAARVDERADLFAFGVLVFEMLTGRLPHEGPSQMAILASKLEHPAGRVRDYARVAFPEGVDRLVARALERDPAARFASAKEVLEAWRELASSPMVGAAPIIDEGLRIGREPPTEISRPSNGTLRIDSSAPRRISSEPFATQTALATHHTSLRGPEGGRSRAAVILAAFGLVAGLLVVVVSLMPRAPRPADVTTGAEPPAAQESAPGPGDDEDAGDLSVPSAEPLETPVEKVGDLPAAASSKPRPRHRSRSSGPPARSSTPKITSQPRY